MRKNSSRGLISTLAWKNVINEENVTKSYTFPFAKKSPMKWLSPNLAKSTVPTFWHSIQGFRFCKRSKFVPSHWLDVPYFNDNSHSKNILKRCEFVRFNLSATETIWTHDPTCQIWWQSFHGRLLGKWSVFFSERVIKVWNSLPCDVTNFSSVKAFKCSLRAIDIFGFCTGSF